METLEKFDQVMLSQKEIGQDHRQGHTHTPHRPRNPMKLIDRWNEGLGRDDRSTRSPPPHRTDFHHSPSPDRESRKSLRSHEDRRDHRDPNP